MRFINKLMVLFRFKVQNINWVKVKFAIVCVLFVSLLKSAPVTPNKVDIESFLEKIKQILQKMEEEAQKAKKKKDKRDKAKIRREILKKLTNPYYRLKRHIINVKKPSPKDSDLADKTSDTLKSLEQISIKTSEILNRILSQQPTLKPFQFPSLRKFLQENKQKVEMGSSSDNVNKPDEKKEIEVDSDTFSSLRSWYSGMLRNLLKFWSMFNIYFVSNETRFLYLVENVCLKEVDTRGGGFKVFRDVKTAIGEVFNIFSEECKDFTSGCFLDYSGDFEPVNPLFSPLATTLEYKAPPSFERVEHYSYYLSKRTSYSCDKIPTTDESLCSALVDLDFYALCKIRKYDSKILGCLRNMDKCKNIAFTLNRSMRYYKRYFTYMEKILKLKLFPLIVDVCYNKCLCKDLGITSCGSNYFNSSEEDIKLALYLLNYSTLKSVEKIDEEWYEVFKEVYDKIRQMKRMELYQKEITKCGAIESDFNAIVRKLYEEWERNVKADIIDIKEYERRFLLYIGEKNLPKVEENYNLYVTSLMNIKETIKGAINQMEKFVQKFGSSNNAVCVAYLVGGFLSSFDMPQKGFNGIWRLTGVDFKNLIERQNDLIRKDLQPFLLYFNLTQSFRNIISEIVILGGKYSENTVATGINLLKTFFKSSQSNLLDYLPYLDYHVYFYNTKYKFAKCVLDTKNLKEFLNGDEKLTDFVDCLFAKKDFKGCVEQKYLAQLTIVKKVLDEFYDIVGIKSLGIGEIEEVLSLVSKFEKEQKKYVDILSGVKNCCGNFDFCSAYVDIDLSRFETFCKDNLERCPVQGQCKFCYEESEGEIKLKCDGGACKEPTSADAQACNAMVEKFSRLLEKLGEMQPQLCKKAVEYLKECKSRPLNCSDVVGINLELFKWFCPQDIIQCPPEERCQICYVEENGKKKLQCSGGSCDMSSGTEWEQCTALLEIVAKIYEKFSQKDEKFCNNAVGFISDCKNSISGCGDLALICSEVFKTNVSKALEIRKSLPKITQLELESIIPDNEIKCSR
jgi:hypothetical protein